MLGYDFLLSIHNLYFLHLFYFLVLYLYLFLQVVFYASDNGAHNEGLVPL